MIAQIVAGVPADGTDFDKLLYLHDYLVRNFAYDYDGLKTETATGKTVAVRDAYNFFKGKVGVCQAYMLALIALCDEVGIPCLPVTSDEMSHAWNLVQLDGEWYHVDITWDDAGGEQSAVYPSYVSYKYFLLSGEALYESGRRVKWQTSRTADDDKYDDALWREATTGMIKKDGEYFFVAYDEALDKAQIYRGTPTQMTAALALDNVKWHGSSLSSHYKQVWVSLVVWEDVIVLNTATGFCYYDAQTNGLTTLAEFNLGDEQFFGIYNISDEGVITCVVAEDYHGYFELRTWQMPDR